MQKKELVWFGCFYIFLLPQTMLPPNDQIANQSCPSGQHQMATLFGVVEKYTRNRLQLSESVPLSHFIGASAEDLNNGPTHPVIPETRGPRRTRVQNERFFSCLFLSLCLSFVMAGLWGIQQENLQALALALVLALACQRKKLIYERQRGQFLLHFPRFSLRR